MLLSQRGFVSVSVFVCCLQVCLAWKTISCQTDKGNILRQFSQGITVWTVEDILNQKFPLPQVLKCTTPHYHCPCMSVRFYKCEGDTNLLSSCCCWPSFCLLNLIGCAYSLADIDYRYYYHTDQCFKQIKFCFSVSSGLTAIWSRG